MMDASTPKLDPLLALTLLLLLSAAASAMRTYNVRDYGAVPDGVTDSTRAFERTWEAACRGGRIDPTPAHILVPNGRYLLRPVVFRGPCAGGVPITMLINATLLAPSTYVDDDKWIEFKSVKRLSISGGTFDGRGESLWKCKAQKSTQCPHGATSLSITKSNDVRLSDLTLFDSARFHMGIRNSTFITVDGVVIDASPDSPNTDGIHVEYSSYVGVYHSIISTGDDCISLSHQSRHIVMDNLTCGPGHGVSIGSLGENPDLVLVEKVFNVTGRNLVFDNTANGLRIKTWASRARGEIRLVIFENVTMIDVKHPIVVVQNYCDNRADKNECHKKADSQIAISHVSYKNVKGSSTQSVAVKFNCSAVRPCTYVSLRDIDIMHRDRHSKMPGKVTAVCRNVWGVSSGVMHPRSCLKSA